MLLNHHPVVCVLFFFSIFQGYCNSTFIIKYLSIKNTLVLSWFLMILRESMALHNLFIQALGEWVKQFLLLKDLFPACQMSFHPLEYLPQTFKQKSNTCVPLCLVCKFGSSVTLLSNSFVTFFHVVWLSIFTRTPLCILNLPHFISLH